MRKLKKVKVLLAIISVFLKFSFAEQYNNQYYYYNVQNPNENSIRIDNTNYQTIKSSPSKDNFFSFNRITKPFKDLNTLIKKKFGWKKSISETSNSIHFEKPVPSSSVAPENKKTKQNTDNNILPEKPKKTLNKINYCKVSPEHTMCRYPPGRASNCKGTGYFTLSKDEQKDIVKRHNQLRKSLSTGFATQPIPKPALPLLKWNYTLAEFAQRWTDQCKFEHDKNRNFGPNIYNPMDRVGQNIAYTSNYNVKNFNITDLLQGWIDEVRDLHPSSVKNLDGNSGFVLHYTQMVWRGTTEIGCAASVYEDYYQGWILNRTQLVCNYYPAGNTIGMAVY